MSFSTFLTQIASVIQSEDGPSLAYYLRPTSPHGKDLIKELRGASVRNYGIVSRACIHLMGPQ